MARRYYNGTVRNLNVGIETFPNSIVAGMFDFEIPHSGLQAQIPAYFQIIVNHGNRLNPIICTDRLRTAGHQKPSDIPFVTIYKAGTSEFGSQKGTD